MNTDKGYQFDISLEYDYAKIFPNGLQFFQNKDGKYGYINSKGEVVIEFVWDYGINFNDGLAYVEAAGKMAYIDEQGLVIWQEQ